MRPHTIPFFRACPRKLTNYCTQAANGPAVTYISNRPTANDAAITAQASIGRVS